LGLYYFPERVGEGALLGGIYALLVQNLRPHADLPVVRLEENLQKRRLGVGGQVSM